ncbi:DUF362 domain-containing protein [Candidatus Pacearchaeota archaeon]|nr:DUF362 domain-containing protein [Candidatus Pacearchaeota archaeon]
MRKRGKTKSSKQEIEKVFVVKCNSYNQKKVDKAVSKALKSIGFNAKDYKGKKVLIKPNVLGSFTKEKQKAITTHPSLVKAVCKILKKAGVKKIFIGDSSFMGTPKAFKKSGIEKVAKQYSVDKKPLIFEQDKLVKIKDSKAKILKDFPISKKASNADLIINMPKMKTHSLAQVTLGIKNLYGLIPGGLKQRLHTKASGRRFSEILVDIYQNMKPQLNILDGVIGMEGEGPSSGTSKKAGLILASRNAIALYIAASKIMGFKPKKIPAIKYALKRKLYSGYKFELIGMKKLPKIPFKKSSKSKSVSGARALFRKEKPIVCDVQKCIKCGTCAKHCPVNAITLKPYPVIDKKKCIRCFCCMEVCPVHALSLGNVGDDVWQNAKKCKPEDVDKSKLKK